MIEFLQKAGIDRHANPAKIAHGYSQISGAGMRAARRHTVQKIVLL